MVEVSPHCLLPAPRSPAGADPAVTVSTAAPSSSADASGITTPRTRESTILAPPQQQIPPRSLELEFHAVSNGSDPSAEGDPLPIQGDVNAAANPQTEVLPPGALEDIAVDAMSPAAGRLVTCWSVEDAPDDETHQVLTVHPWGVIMPYRDQPAPLAGDDARPLCPSQQPPTVSNSSWLHLVCTLIYAGRVPTSRNVFALTGLNLADHENAHPSGDIQLRASISGMNVSQDVDESMPFGWVFGWDARVWMPRHWQRNVVLELTHHRRACDAACTLDHTHVRVGVDDAVLASRAAAWARDNGVLDLKPAWLYGATLLSPDLSPGDTSEARVSFGDSAGLGPSHIVIQEWLVDSLMKDLKASMTYRERPTVRRTMQIPDPQDDDLFSCSDW